MAILPQLRQLRQRLQRRLTLPSKPQLVQWGRQVRRVVQPTLVTYLGMKTYKGKQIYDPKRPTLLVVSHEASATGAPILAWNLCQHFNRSHNIVVLLLRSGSMIPDFQEYSLAALRARQEVVTTKQLRRELHHLLGSSLPDVAIVNSIVSHPFIKPLRSLGIGVVSLIHEFPSSLRPAHLFSDIGVWSTYLVFSSDLTRQDLYDSFPQLHSVRTEVFAQGPCKRPDRPGRVAAAHPSLAGLDAQDLLAGLNSNTLFVLGAGEVQHRKGVDLFIAVAAQLCRMCPDLQIQFAWIGCGYDPLYDSQLSLWLQDQIVRSGLEGNLSMLEHSSAYKDLLSRCDLFLMPSRLDPLPNVAVDALLVGKPVICFENACGIASILLKDPELGPAWVSPYFDVHAMAIQSKEMLINRDLCSQLTLRSRQLAKHSFDMPAYCQHLSSLVWHVAEQVELERESITMLIQSRIIDLSYATPLVAHNRELATMEYVLSWRQSIWPRKPYAGFHPGIYREHCLKSNYAVDPTLHFHHAGTPDGPWKYSLLIGAKAQPVPNHPPRAALHIHVNRIDVLPGILDLVRCNDLQPDIYVTSSDHSLGHVIELEHSKRGLTLIQHVIVPRRGRDVAALLLSVLDRFDRDYDIYGHVHTNYQYGLANSNPGTYQAFLLSSMIGNQKFRMIDLVTSKFLEDPSLGLVFPADPICFRANLNQPSFQLLTDQLKLSSSSPWLDYPVGSMFWVRANCLQRYKELDLGWNDYSSDLFTEVDPLAESILQTIPLVVKQCGLQSLQAFLPGHSR